MRRLAACLIAFSMLFGAARCEGMLNLAPDAPPTVRVFNAGAIVEMDLEEYLVGVLAAEMPAGYEVEALKAQAVAARTYTLYKLDRGGCRSNAGADVCTNSGCCQAYATQARLRERWGDRFDERMARVRGAVDATAGQLVTYDGEPIEALYHASSGGHTEDVEQVYAVALPYLRGVQSDGEQSAPQYRGEQSFTADQLAAALGVNARGLSVEVLSRTEYGRAARVAAGGAVFEGTAFRRKLGLRSSNFTVTEDGGRFTFHTLGYGHGVGMSQVGANAMALRGADYREILTWYYTGTQVG
ncbi:MAG: stage II sporulation protein D [Clostridiales bacterium]|nr:stage II sporulation protein D [Clostridiales bacterium]